MSSNNRSTLVFLSVLVLALLVAVPAAAAPPGAVGPGDGAAGGTMGGVIFYITVALLFSFLCSLLEAGLLSTSSSHVEVMVEQGKRSGTLMRRLRENVERPISAILTLNTIAHTVGAANAGAEAAGVFGSEFLGLITVVLTLMILVFSEIIPKTLGAVYWKPLFPFTAYACQALVIIFYPFVWMFQFIGRVLAPRTEQPTVTRNELEVMARISQDEGALEYTEHLILTNLLHLDRAPVESIMTPRTVLFSVSEDTTVGEMMKKHRVLPYSRIPIYNETVDDVTAFVLRYDILTAAAEDRPHVPLKDLGRELHSIPETISVAKAMQQFIQSKQHIFLVFDEYGGTAGILTMEDVVESLLGTEITDESDTVEDLRKLAAQRYNRQRHLLGLITEDGANSIPAVNGRINYDQYRNGREAKGEGTKPPVETPESGERA